MSRNEEIFTRRGNDRVRDRSSGGGRDRSPLNRSARQNRDDCRVFVSNLPYEFRWQDVKALFRREVGEVGYVELFTDENDKSKGSGIIEFENPDDAKKAIDKLHRHDVEGRKIVVKEDYGAPRDKYGNLLRNRGDGGRNEDKNNSRGPPNRDAGPISNKNYDWGETYGLSRNFLDGLNIAPPLGCRVFVANLDYKVTEKKLREVFKLAGKVRDVELQTDAEGKSRGFAIVEYDHPVESVQAISMLHNQPLYDRRLTVRLDRDTKDTGRLPEGLHAIGMGLGQNGAPLRDVARNLPNASSNSQANSMPTMASQNSLSALTAAAALSNPLAAIGGLTPSAAALQAAAMLAPGGAGLLSSSALNSLAGTRSDSLSRDLPFASLAGLGSNSILNDNSASALHSLGSGRDSYNDRNSPPPRNNSAPKSSDTVIVDNLPHNYTWQELKEQFRDAGDIKFAEMRGKLGLVRFASDWEALRAVSLLDRTRVDGQMIDVRLF